MKQINVGVIGCGWIAQNVHIPCYVENPKSRLVAICDANKELLEKTSQKFNVRNAFVDYEELLKSNLVDAVSICTPTATHSKVAVEVAKHGVHALCEKPLASSVTEAEEIIQAVSTSGTKFMVGFNYRFLPNHTTTKRFIDSGRIGKPILIRGEVIAPGPYRSDISRESHQFEAEKRRGAFFDLGSHLADLFIWMMGKPKEVYAAFSSHNTNVGVDDSATALIVFQSNVIGSISVSWIALPDYQSIADSRTIEVVGNKGMIESDFFGPSLSFYSSDSVSSKIRGKVRILPVKFDSRIPDEALKWSYKKEIDSFLESIVKGTKIPITLDHGMQVLKLVVGAYESARRRSAVNLE